MLNTLMSLPTFTTQISGGRAVMRPTGEILGDVGALVSLSLAVAIIVGVAIFLYGIWLFYKMSREPGRYTVSQAIQNLVAGTILITPSFFYLVFKATGSAGDWAHRRDALALNPAQLQHDSTGLANSFLGQYLPGELIVLFMGLLFLIGLLAFLRGAYLIREVGTQPPGQGTGPGKILTHIIGGMMLMNIGPVTQALIATFFVV